MVKHNMHVTCNVTLLCITLCYTLCKWLCDHVCMSWLYVCLTLPPLSVYCMYTFPAYDPLPDNNIIYKQYRSVKYYSLDLHCIVCYINGCLIVL